MTIQFFRMRDKWIIFEHKPTGSQKEKNVNMGSWKEICALKGGTSIANHTKTVENFQIIYLSNSAQMFYS